MESVKKPHLIDTTPKPIVYREKIGPTTWEFVEQHLDVFDDVSLWAENPRLRPHLPADTVHSEEELEAKLRKMPGYDTLKKSIQKFGQMEPIYAWKGEGGSCHLVYEGATRVTILRELERAAKGTPNEGRYRRVRAKILPATFSEIDRVILLARIHVRGNGVRGWGRYMEGWFIYENVAGTHRTMSVTEMADHMEKSVSWVVRLRDAYEFALRFVQHIDDPAVGEAMAFQRFSVLEEISKAGTIGPMLRDYNNPAYDSLRSDVFEMVRNEVFKEYRDARFLREFYENPEAWALLKTGEKHIASRLAAEVKANTNSLKAKIANLESAVERAVQGSDHGLDERDIEHLRHALALVHRNVHMDADPFRIELRNATKLLENTTMANARSLPPDEVAAFREALGCFDMLIDKYGIKA